MKIPKFFHPLFLLVLGLHAGLLMIPVSGSSDQVIPAPDPEGDTISVDRIPPIESEETAESNAAASNAAVSPQTVAVQTARRTTPTQSSPRTRSSPEATPPTSATSRTNQVRPSSGRTPSTLANPTPQHNQPRNNSANSTDLPDLSSSNQPQQTLSRAPVTTPNSQPTVAAPPTPPTLITLTNNATRTLPDTLAQLANWFTGLYIYKDANTTADAEDVEKQHWLATVRAQSDKEIPDPQPLAEPVKVAYPLEKSLHYERDFVSCLVEKPHPASVGILVNAAGELVEDPILLRSTGYEFLNQEAIARVKVQENLPMETSERVYIVDIEIEYDKDVCVTLPSKE